MISDLRAKLKEIQAENLEELELLKVKMGQLHQADVKSLENYF